MLQNGMHPSNALYHRLTEQEKLITDGVQWRLDSYHYVGTERYVSMMRKIGVPIFLDSGAFSAFTMGVRMDLRKYCHFVNTNRDCFAHASVLDAIGDADETYRNQKRMEELGVDALPCYHYGEPEHVLEYYAANYEYITIGGMVPISTPQLKIWLDRIWSRHLTNSDGSARIKVHGFGLTSVPLMVRYPWFSVDSSSWVQVSGMGNIFIPQFGMLAVSPHSPSAKVEGKHFDTLPEVQQDALLHLIQEQQGFDMERLKDSYLSRRVYNIMSYSSFTKDSEHKRFKAPQPGLF